MDIQQLKAFREVASQRSFSAAAKTLFLSQPAVSRQISSLETEIGMPLFIRLGSHIALTDPGRKLLSYAEDILHTMEQAERTLQNLQDLKSGSVTVAAGPYLSRYFLPRFAGGFHHRYPGLRLRVVTSPQEDLFELLSLGKADLAVYCRMPEEHSLTLEEICREEICFVAKGSLLSSLSANLEQFAPFLYPPLTETFGEAVEELLPAALRREECPVLIESLEGIKAALMEGFGCSILPESLVRLEFEHGLLDARPTGRTCPIFLTYPKDARLPNSVLLFMGLMRKALFMQNLTSLE